MEGKVCLVTGATSGIGYETARGLAAAGARVVLAGRDLAKGARVRQQISESSGNPHVDYLNADLSSQEQVRRLASDFKDRYDRLDVLVNNAGAAFLRRKLSADGIERTFALNHLSYFLLTCLLLEVIEASAPARIVNISSASHLNARIEFDDLGLERGYWVMRAYGQSKLGNLLFTFELASRLEGTNVTSNAMHPGWVRTNIGRDNGLPVRLLMQLLQMGARSAAEGARTILYLAASPEVEGVSGKYFIDERPVRSSAASHDRDSARRLWAISAQMTGLAD
jgi:NAD(P)-dependent dehydrogenase (short-subunit alcohol dehydrogenase family)